jgi:hypothetical protein
MAAAHSGSVSLAKMSGRSPYSSPKIDKRVAVLIERMSAQKTEQQAFTELELLGCPAVPAIIEQMDDRRKLPDSRISLRNKSPDLFEGLRHYGPEKIGWRDFLHTTPAAKLCDAG